MSENCSSSPKGSCSDSKTLEQLLEISGLVETKLTTIIDKKRQIIIDLNECADANNGILDEIITEFETIILEDCCDEINANLQDIIDLLNGKVYSDSCELDGTIECNITVTTTIEPTTTTGTTTIEPTTTEDLTENSGIFYVSNVMQLPCIEDSLPDENEVTLYYTGTFGVGSTMYTDEVEGTLFSGYLYIKKLGSLSVYNIGYESGVVGTLAYTCE